MGGGSSITGEEKSKAIAGGCDSILPTAMASNAEGLYGLHCQCRGILLFEVVGFPLKQFYMEEFKNWSEQGLPLPANPDQATAICTRAVDRCREDKECRPNVEGPAAVTVEM